MHNHFINRILFFFITGALLVTSPASYAGTGKILSWCSYLDWKNDNNGDIKKMRCIVTMGAANTYCFNYVFLKNGLKTGGDCDEWLSFQGNLSELPKKDIQRLQAGIPNWKISQPVIILKNRKTKDIIVIHDNETSSQLQQCEKQEWPAAGDVRKSDICWLGNIARKNPY